jgi:uncharacterized protein HemY
MLVVGVAGYQLNFGQTGRRLNEKFFERVALKRLRGTGGNASLFYMLGDVYFGNGNFGQAAAAYQNSLDMEPDNAIVMNNYAWLLATCDDPAYRNPERHWNWHAGPPPSSNPLTF